MKKKIEYKTLKLKVPKPLKPSLHPCAGLRGRLEDPRQANTGTQIFSISSPSPLTSQRLYPESEPDVDKWQRTCLRFPRTFESGSQPGLFDLVPSNSSPRKVKWLQPLGGNDRKHLSQLLPLMGLRTLHRTGHLRCYCSTYWSRIVQLPVNCCKIMTILRLRMSFPLRDEGLPPLHTHTHINSKSHCALFTKWPRLSPGHLKITI